VPSFEPAIKALLRERRGEDRKKEREEGKDKRGEIDSGGEKRVKRKGKV
jgi:hypothetical protein